EPNDGDNHYQDFGHSHWHNSLIWAEGMENIAITGPGRIWGKGLSRGAGREGPRAESPGVGNKSIALKNCRNVILRDFSILHGGHFGILATGADNLTIDNLKIDTNRDGMDIDCCRNVRISNCYVNSPWDDGICLKSSCGLGSARPTEFVTISDCYVSGCFEEGTLLDATYKRFAPEERVPHTGRIKFGTESNGGFRNITISNCVFEGCQGLALETVDGALLEDVTVTNISMRDIISAPIFLRLGRRMRGPKDLAIGTLKRIIISNVVCSNSVARLGSIISGIPGHEIEDVKISNVTVQHQGGGTKEDAALQPAEREETYPEPGMFGTMPSHGFYVRHVKGIQFDNIDIRPAKEDQRPAFVLDQVEDADFFRIKTPKVANVPVFALSKVEDFSAHFCNGVPDTHIDRTDHQTIG
ncbi:MAG TPA: right-handed parallel beta-helix repeat-containing protein, partial [Bryobacteraceae bacterium]|nr:right-handed parallel beta-helix repeat-containing protein [Bryobacteraceae bacterium]